ncbi:MAG: hypothetical protein Q7S77_00735 [Candidatus Staskawiczbacteria bacterium]|nr:hypothetical protein [Candidatus Staskawiczbacteria bacterium]
MKKVIIIAIILIALSSAYYFVIFLPPQKQAELKQAKQAFLFNKNSECQKICENIYQEDKKSLGESSVFNSLYAYNEEKNACFYSGGWLNVDAKAKSFLTKRVVNCQTNKEILTYMEIDGKVFNSFCDSCANSNEEYNKKEAEFMGD